jgi:hypothetical protein
VGVNPCPSLPPAHPIRTGVVWWSREGTEGGATGWGAGRLILNQSGPPKRSNLALPCRPLESGFPGVPPSRSGRSPKRREACARFRPVRRRRVHPITLRFPMAAGLKVQ